MKKQSIFISLLAIVCLAGCNSNKPEGSVKPVDSDDSSTIPEPSEDTCVIDGFGIYKLEAENFNSEDWIPEENDVIVEEAKASGGAYLAA